MKRNMKQALVLPALLLTLAASPSITGCSQSDDIPAATTGIIARGGEPIGVSIAPRRGYAAGDNTPATRHAIADDGSFTWEVENPATSTFGDMIFFRIIFDDPAATQIYQTWIYDPGNTDYFLPDWRINTGWMSGVTENPDFRLTWPTGAGSALVQAFHSDCTSYTVSGSSAAPKYLQFSYGGNNAPPGITGDHMFFEKTVTVGTDIGVDLEHTTTRLVFKGLKADTGYNLYVNGVSMDHLTALETSTFNLAFGTTQAFLSDAGGKLTICSSINNAINSVNGKVAVELKLSATGVKAVTAEITAQGTPGAYVTNGYMYTLNTPSGGPIDPDSSEDLLPPPLYNGHLGNLLAIPGCVSYWVAPENAITNIAWESINFNTACPAGWKVPSQADFEAMLGRDAEQGWVADDYDAITAAFPAGNYWTSTEKDSGRAYAFIMNAGDSTTNFLYDQETYTLNVRCVRAK